MSIYSTYLISATTRGYSQIKINTVRDGWSAGCLQSEKSPYRCPNLISREVGRRDISKAKEKHFVSDGQQDEEMKEFLLAGWWCLLALFDLELKRRITSLYHLKVIPETGWKAWLLILQAWLLNLNPLTCQHNLQGECSCLQIDRCSKMEEKYTWSQFCFQPGRDLAFKLSA